MRAKTLKTAIFGTSILGAALYAAAASAVPIGLPNGGLQVKLDGIEEFSANVDTYNSGTIASPIYTAASAYGGSLSGLHAGGEGTWGVFVVSSIGPAMPAVPNSELAASGFPFFVNGQNGGNQILAIVYGAQTNLPPGAPTTSKYGVLDLFWWDSNNQSAFATGATGGNALRNDTGGRGPATTGSGYAGYTCAADNVAGSGCYLLAEFDLVPGNFLGTDPTGAIGNTIFSAINPALGIAGAGYFEAMVDPSKGGYWADELNTDYFTLNNPATLSQPLPIPSDLNGQTGFSSCFALCPGWQGTALIITDPGQAFSTAVPEPSTLALFGIGLFGLGFMFRRNKAW